MMDISYFVLFGLQNRVIILVYPHNASQSRFLQTLFCMDCGIRIKDRRVLVYFLLVKLYFFKSSAYELLYTVLLIRCGNTYGMYVHCIYYRFL